MSGLGRFTRHGKGGDTPKGEPIETFCMDHWTPLIPEIEAGDLNGILLSVMMVQRLLGDLARAFPGGNLSALSLSEGPGCCYYARRGELELMVEAARNRTLDALPHHQLAEPGALEDYLEEVRERLAEDEPESV